MFDTNMFNLKCLSTQGKKMCRRLQLAVVTLTLMAMTIVKGSCSVAIGLS